MWRHNCASLEEGAEVHVLVFSTAEESGLPEDIAYLTLYFRDNLIAHVHVNWLSPVKIRRMIVAGSAKTIVFDDLVADEKIKLYSRGVTRQEDMVGTNLVPVVYRRTGDIWIPQFEQTEALEVMAQHFVHCCSTGATPRTGGQQALQIVHGIDFGRVRTAANSDGEAAILRPGIGVGGHCTPVYPYFLRSAQVCRSAARWLPSMIRCTPTLNCGATASSRALSMAQRW